MVRNRALTGPERAALDHVLGSDDLWAAEELRAQARAASLWGGRPTFLDLTVEEGLPPAEVGHGPLPVKGVVSLGAPGTNLIGEIVVWVRGGYLSGLEFCLIPGSLP